MGRARGEWRWAVKKCGGGARRHASRWAALEAGAELLGLFWQTVDYSLLKGEGGREIKKSETKRRVKEYRGKGETRKESCSGLGHGPGEA